MKRIPIIIDCDPGTDDAMAIMLANACGRFDIRAITAVAGNVELKHTAANALALATYYGIDTVVAQGADRPMIIGQKIAPEWHGNNGMGGFEFPPHDKKLDGRWAWDVIYDEAKKFPGEMVLFAVGPMTNVALAIKKYPKLREYLKRIIIMGGSATVGNHSQYAEFNIWVDPHAMDIVLKSGIPITMVGLNVTQQAYITNEEYRTLARYETSVQPLIQTISEFSIKAHSETPLTELRGKNILHDALAVAELLDDTLMEKVPYYVACETRGKHTFGQTVVDYGGRWGREPNVDVAMKVDRERFLKIMTDAVLYYSVKGGSKHE